MGALVIEKVTGVTIRCRDQGCKNSGRYRMRIAGYYVMAEGTLTHQKALLCKKHAEAARELWDDVLADSHPAPDREAVAAA